MTEPIDRCHPVAPARYGAQALVTARRMALRGAVVASVGLGAAATGWTQTSQPPAAPALEQPAPEPAPPDHRPGLVDEIQKLLPAPGWPLTSPQQTIDDLNKRARDAGDNLSRLSTQKVIAGRVKCPLAPNGAPDCAAAAKTLCADAGFKDGRSVDSDSAESCPASVLLSGKTADPNASDCHVENFVIRALCQR